MQTSPYAAPNAPVADPIETYGEVKALSTKGRLGRVRFIGYSMALSFLIMIPVLLISIVVGPLAPFVMIIGYVALMIVQFMLTIQRCHDFNASGWWSITYLVPLVGLLFWIIPGTDGPNRFGNKTPPNSGGVILLALLPVVIVPIIGILAAIAIPAYQQYVQRAQAAQVQGK